MHTIVEVNERGAIQLPTDLLVTLKPHTRFVLEVQGKTLLLHPVGTPPVLADGDTTGTGSSSTSLGCARATSCSTSTESCIAP